MKTLYLDCGMGAAGDMLTAALLELLPDPDAFIARLNAIGIPEVKFARERVPQCGILGTKITVTVRGIEESTCDAHKHCHEHCREHEYSHEHAHEHSHGHEHCHEHGHSHEHTHSHEHMHSHEHTHVHRGMADMEALISALLLPEKVKRDVTAVYHLIADAESAAHGVPVSEIHFHEVGALDAVADIAAVCLLIDTLAPEKIVASPVHVGSGHVHCAHGILPVPAPATAFILRGVPAYSTDIRGELCTPTGAALLKHFADEFGAMPLMKTQAVGYGMGTKKFEQLNCVRALLGDSPEQAETIFELCCNVDDMTPEAVGFAMERLFDAGALDVYTTPIGMKKSRPGVLLCVMCSASVRDTVIQALFKHTTTLGVREQSSRRYVLRRRFKTLETSDGTVRVKSAEGYGVSRSKYEYEDLARIAREKGISLAEVLQSIPTDF